MYSSSVTVRHEGRHIWKIRKPASWAIPILSTVCAVDMAMTPTMGCRPFRPVSSLKT